MRKFLMAGMMGAGMFMLLPVEAEAQSCRQRGSSYAPARYGVSYDYRTHRGYDSAHFSVRRAPTPTPRFYTARHCVRCVPVQERVWVERTTYQQVFAGYDACGRPCYVTVAVPSGCWEVRTRYRCH